MKEEKNSQWVEDLRREHLRGSTRNPGAAALMSFFVMGLGQIYAGHIDRGIALMSVYFGGIFAAVSTYNGGMIYNAVFPLLGAHLMVIATYVLSVIFILLWIYNIKDAYYLSLFSSFRDWFEVERVLLPVIKNSAGLIAQHSRSAGLLTHEATEKSPEPAKVEEQHEDAHVIEVSAQKPAESKPEESGDEDEVESLEPGQVVYTADFGTMKMNGQSWKIYLGMAMIFILIGLWLDKRGNEGGYEANTHFTVTADLGARDTLTVAAISSQSAPVSAISQTRPEPAPSVISEVVKAPEAMPTVVQPPAEVMTAPVVDAPLPFAQGMEMVKAGNYPEAARLFEEDLAANEPDKAQWRVILNSFFRADNMVAYELNLRRYLETYADDTQAWLNLGKLLYDRSELAQASQAIMKGLRSDPENVRGNYLLGSIYLDLKLYPESVTPLEKALTLEPLNIDFNRQLARALSLSGRQSEARRYFQRILSLSPDDAEARQNLQGNIMTGSGEGIVVVQGKGEERIVEKQTAETVDLPVSGKVLFEAGSIIEPPPATEIKPTAAVEDASAPVAAVVSTPAAAVEPVVPAEYVVPAEPVAVSKPAAPVVAVIPSVPPAVAVKPVPAKVEEPAAPPPVIEEPVTEKPVAARPVENVSVAAAPEVVVKSVKEADAAVFKKKIAEQIKKSGLSPSEAQTDSGEDVFRDAVAQEPEKKTLDRKVEEFRKKGAFEFSRGNWEAALPNYLEVLKHSRDAQTYDMIGVIFEKLSMPKDAFDAVERSYKLGRRDAVTLTRLGRLAETTGNFTKGEQYLRQALEMSPHRVDLRIRYAKCLEANGNSSQAIAELEKIAKAGGDSYALKRRAELEIARIKSAR